VWLPIVTIPSRSFGHDSADHAVSVEDVLIPIKYLTNGETIHQAPCETVEYFHLELPSHDLLLADSVAVESYLDTGDRSSFENAGRVITLFPELSSLKWEAYGYAPPVVSVPPSKPPPPHRNPGTASGQKAAPAKARRDVLMRQGSQNPATLADQ
jgi:Hint domain